MHLSVLVQRVNVHPSLEGIVRRVVLVAELTEHSTGIEAAEEVLIHLRLTRLDQVNGDDGQLGANLPRAGGRQAELEMGHQLGRWHVLLHDHAF